MIDEKKPFSHRLSAKDGDNTFLAVNLPLQLVDKQNLNEQTLPSSQRNS